MPDAPIRGRVVINTAWAEEFLESLRLIREDMRVDQREALRIGNNEGSAFYRGEVSGIGYAIDLLEKELEQ